MSPIHKILSAVVLSLAVLALAAPAEAAKFEKTYDFQLDEWLDIDYSDGPITLHKIRLEVQAGKLKSKIFRPGNSEYLETIQIQIQYTNESDDDEKARLEIAWLDGRGEVIDGYNDSETMDEDERREEMTVTLSTLKYGLEVADKLRVSIEF